MEKEVSDADRRALVKKKYLDKISYFLSRPAIDPEDLFVLVRGFFVEFLKLEYEFTYEELTIELNRIFIKPDDKKYVDKFLLDLSECEYLIESDLTVDEVKDFLQRMQKVILILVNEELIIAKKHSLFEKLFSKSVDKKPSYKPPTDAFQDARNDGMDSSIKIQQPISDDNKASATLPPAIQASLQSQNTQMTAQTQMISKTNPNPEPENEVPVSASPVQNAQLSIIDPGSNGLFISQDAASNPVPYKEAIPDKRMPETLKPARTPMQSATIQRRPADKARHHQASRDSLLIETNAPGIVMLRELMEESYFNISRKDMDNARTSYLKALQSYHGLGSEDKKLVYFELLGLYKTIMRY
jgi:hypothetical protein